MGQGENPQREDDGHDGIHDGQGEKVREGRDGETDEHGARDDVCGEAALERLLPTGVHGRFTQAGGGGGGRARAVARVVCAGRRPLPASGCAGRGTVDTGQEAQEAREGKRSVPLRIVDLGLGSTLLYVPVTFAGPGTVDFVLDTGASKTALERRLAERLGLPAAAGVVGGVAGVGTDGGGGTQVLRVEEWRMGEVELPASTVVTVDLSDLSLPGGQGQPQGLLGSDVLREFGAVTIDYAGQRLLF